MNEILDLHPARLQRVVHAARYVAEPGNLVGEPSASASTPALSGLKVGREAELFS